MILVAVLTCVFVVFCNFSKTVVLCKNSTTLARQLDFQGLEGSGTEYFCFCSVSGFWIGLEIVF